jgi:hypothetical protein
MPWNVHPTVVTGQTWSAADENTYVKGNLDTLFPYSAGMQVAYSTSTVSLNKATTSAKLQVLRSNITNTAIEFGSLVYRTQNASTAGSTDTTPASTIIQCGTYTIGGTAGSTVSVTFPTSFSNIPFLYLQPVATLIVLSTASFNFLLVSTSTNVYSWFAMGTP